MRQSGWGRIVNVSSVAGVMPQPTGPDYSAGKAAINNLSLSLTKALGASGVAGLPAMPHGRRSSELF
jgi:3-oxoacyl-[acyl-carrier protein] reductase